MANKMLIDAAHPEETRVVVLRGKRVEEFDYESASRKQLRGNIYLAKVTRVEPSLQAAFVDYGGNRHGFLAFSEIHPDYYQIPVADRQALLEEEARAGAEENDLDDYTQSMDAPYNDDEDGYQDEVEEIGASGDEEKQSEEPKKEKNSKKNTSIALELETKQDEISEEVPATDKEATVSEEKKPDEVSAETSDNTVVETKEPEKQSEEDNQPAPEIQAEVNDAPLAKDEKADLADDEDDTEDDVESVGSEDALEELPQRPRRRRRVYKIQEVIRRRQIILVQVVKEERGNKGAALTTYLSLAGRHTVLMPNTARGGGISRKITNPADRKRLRKIAGELEVPEGTGLIIRTAGASRTKAEIKRDYEYLLRLWENVRDLTMESTAPAVVYEEGDLIKRSIRDLYSKEIDEVVVAGEEAYKDAKTFMRMIMPSHAKNVKLYKDNEPLFIKNQIERQLNEMYSPYVTLPAGGYIVINQTEALVSVDVNSGKSTKEHSIEDTALRTNLEAAEEIARQLRLRDLAGLVVIDFIDMDERRNNRAVERKLKECLRNDRARIQVGRISHFGLLEMSRQRLRTGVLEGSTTQCPHCQGTGIIRSTDSVALSVLRALEDTLLAGEVEDLTAITSVDVALYVLNQKRSYLKDIEARYGVCINIVADQKLQGANFQIERLENTDGVTREKNVVVKMDWAFEPPETKPAKAEEDDNKKRRKRRRRRKERGDVNETVETLDGQSSVSSDPTDETQEDLNTVSADGDDDENSERRSRTRRRGRRGGRRHRSSVNRKDENETSPEQVSASEGEGAETKVEATSESTQESTGDAAATDQVESSGESKDAQGDEDNSRENRGRTRRRFPAGRRRSPRRRNNQSDTAPHAENTPQPVINIEISEAGGEQTSAPKPRGRKPRPPRNEASKSEDTKVQQKTPAEPAQQQEAKPSANSSMNGAESKPQKAPAAEKQKAPIEKSNAPAAPVKQNPDAPTRKGWWQKRAQ
ncbi:MAG: Rne/Rng family ribonuclease [Methyloligellaceae bacterium]